MGRKLLKKEKLNNSDIEYIKTEDFNKSDLDYIESVSNKNYPSKNYISQIIYSVLEKIDNGVLYLEKYLERKAYERIINKQLKYINNKYK